MTTLKPFADDSASQTIAGLTIENGTDKIGIYGSIGVTRDKTGLAHARALKAILDATVQALEAERDLPEAIPPAEPAVTVKNPFA